MPVTKAAALALLLALAIAAGCTGIPAGPPPADEIAERFVATQEQTEDFSAVVAVTTVSSGDVTVRLFEKAPESYRIEFLEPAGLAGTVAVSNGTRKWRYDPATQTALTVAGPYIGATFSEPPYPAWAEEVCGYADMIAEALAEQNASYCGTEAVDGRTAYVLEVSGESGLFDAPTRYRPAVYRFRAWIDAETWLLLAVEMYGKKGDLILSAEYTEPSANTGIPESRFVFEPPAEAEIRPMATFAITPLFFETLDNARRYGAEEMVPSHLPEGYAFASGVHLPGAYTELRFTNGSDDLQCEKRLYDPYFAEETVPGTADPVRFGDGRQAEYVSADGAGEVRWTAGGFAYRIAGAISRDDLIRVAASVGV